MDWNVQLMNFLLCKYVCSPLPEEISFKWPGARAVEVGRAALKSCISHMILLVSIELN